MSPRKGSGPSMLLVVEAGKWLLQTCGPPTLKSKRGGQLAGSDWVLLRAINRRRVAASWLHLHAVSKATTTRRARPPPTISGYVLSLARRAMRSAAPDVVRWWRRGWAWDVSGETKVVSMANCAPFQRGSPFAIASIRRSSVRVLWVFKSLRRTLVHTEAPASRQMRAMARSRATPRARKAPERGHAAR